MNAPRTPHARRALLPVLAPALLLAVAAAIAPRAFGTTFTVDTSGSAPDALLGNGACAISGGGCTLHAAIEEINAIGGGPHTIAFSISVVTLTESLPPLVKPVIVDGGGSRTEISGGPGPSFGTNGGFVVNSTASPTTIRNLVVNWMGGPGISLIDGGNTVENCYVGTNAAGTAAKPNNGPGISVTTTALGPYPTPPMPPNIGLVVGNIIGHPSDGAKGNLISGNLGDGVAIFAERTVKNIVAYNVIGANALVTAAIPNVGHGVSISGFAYKNTIGPGNWICGDKTDTLHDGIYIQGKVWEPNVVTGNVIGASKDLLTNLGFGRNGIRVESTRYDPVAVPEVATLGPSNVVGFSGEEGIMVTSGAERVRIFGNFIGIGATAASPTVFHDLGNMKEGIFLTTSGVSPTDNTTSGHLIGGVTPASMNVISANGKIAAGAAGIRLSSLSTDTRIQGNVIGRDPLNLLNFPNSKDGIFVEGSGHNVIGGTGVGEANVIAGNGRNGVKITSSGNGWANLVSGNAIFGNHTLENGLGIDLEYVAQGADPTNNTDPATNYSNYGQNAPVVSTGAGAPYYDTATGNTVVDWTLDTSAGTPITLEFFASDAAGFSGNGEGQVYLGKTTITTDGSGHAAGATPITPSTPLDSRTKYVTMTATPTNTIDPPGTVNSGPANNTSEFSNAVRVPNPGVLQFSATTFGVGESGGSVTITVTRTGGSDGAVSVDYATSDGTANQPGDYAAASGTLNWADADSASKTFSVAIASDTTYEGNETVQLALSGPGGHATLGANTTATLTITDDDVQPSISIAPFSLLEGDSGLTPFVFAVTLSGPSAQTVAASWATFDGSAFAPGDYVAGSGTVTFLPGVVAQTVTVNVVGETTNESDETFTVGLSSPSNATIGVGTGLGTILNDDAATPTFTIGNVTQAEGNAGTSSYVFTVTLSPAAAAAATVQAATSNGTATTADGDYVANTQTLNFAAGVTTQSFTVTVNGDTKFEPTEDFTVTLSAGSVGTAIGGGGAATGTITNDDTAPTISISDVSALEGNSGTTAFTFNVTLSNASSQTVTVNTATADGTATQPADYAPAGGTLTFNPGVTTQPVTVNVAGETTNEPDETFFVNLTAPSNASILDAQGVGTIQNDDSTTPTFTIGSVTQAEGNAGTSSFVFAVTLSPAAAGPVSVQAATSDGTATTADGDYVANAQTLTFAAGATTQTFTVTVNGDTKFEPTEDFTVTLSAGSGGTVIGGGGTATGTITNDDTAPTISIGDVSALEGNSGTTAFTFNVTLSNATSQTVTVNHATADGTATQPGDYAPAGGTLTFNPGVTTQPVTVNVAGETTNEPDETFFVNLTAPSNASILDGQGLGTIQNDDSTTPTFTITNVSQAEGDAGTTLFSFTVSLSPAAVAPASVQAATADGTATAASGDYVASTQTLNFAAGVTSQPFTVTVNGDGTFEPDETFSVNLSASSAGTAIGGGATASGTITGDDPQPAISLANVVAPAAGAGNVTFTFTLTLSNPSSQSISVNWATDDGTASAAAGDYVAANGTVTFPAGSTTQTFSVTITTHATSGPAKTFFVNLSVPLNATIATVQAVGTILPATSAEAVVPVLGRAALAFLSLLVAAAGAWALRRSA
ncbi:MAG: hypothetical protein IPN83_15160 [Holophagales bacterium]|nr:hypothetical protein [Holophagales bacterium]